MADSREEQIVEVPRELRAGCPGVQAVVLQLYLRGESGDLVLARVNESVALACLVNHRAKTGMTLLEDNRCAKRLSVII